MYKLFSKVFMKLKNALVFISGAVMIAFVYMVLSESFSLNSMIVGAALGFGSMLVCVLLFPDNFLSRYHVRLLPLIWYLLCLIFIVIISGIKSLILGFSKNSASILITYKSTLESDMLITLLANSITLTPGTATVDKSGKTLKVIKLCKKGCENDLSDIKLLEKMISRAERAKA